MVDRPQPLGAVPGDGDLPVQVAGLQRRLQLGPVLGGESLRAAAQQPPHLKQRVILVAAMTQRLLLHPAAHLVHGGVAQLHNVERVQHPDCVGQPVGQRGGIPAERIKRGDLDAAPPGLLLLGDPVRVHLPAATLDDVEQPGRATIGEVDDAGGVLGAPARAGVLPHVLVHSERAHPVQPSRVVDQWAAVVAD